MSRTIAWFTAVIGYVIQTKSLSVIQSDKFLSLDSIRSGGHMDISKVTAGQMREAMTIYLTFLHFVAIMLLLPIAALFTKDREVEIEFEMDYPQEYELQEMLPRTGAGTTEGRPLSMDLSLDLSNLIPHEPTPPAASVLPSSSSLSASPSTTALASSQGNSFSLQNMFGFILPAFSAGSTALYVMKLLILASFLMIPVFTYMLALSLSPAFDVALIHNTSVFEIVTLLYGVCGISRRKYIFRNFLVMSAALFSILIISYTKATCDMLAGKLSINPTTGEVSDPYLFDRLKASLLCGLGNLPIGLFAVMWNRWFGQRSNTMQQQSAHLSMVAIICIIMLAPFGPKFTIFYDCIQLFNGDELFWLTLVCSIFLGTVPFMYSILYLNRVSPPEYLTTCNLGAIIFMGIMEWLTEPVQTTIVRWEVIGYIILSLSCIFLSMVLN